MLSAREVLTNFKSAYSLKGRTPSNTILVCRTLRQIRLSSAGAISILPMSTIVESIAMLSKCLIDEDLVTFSQKLQCTTNYVCYLIELALRMFDLIYLIILLVKIEIEAHCRSDRRPSTMLGIGRQLTYNSQA